MNYCFLCNKEVEEDDEEVSSVTVYPFDNDEEVEYLLHSICLEDNPRLLIQRIYATFGYNV